MTNASGMEFIFRRVAIGFRCLKFSACILKVGFGRNLVREQFFFTRERFAGQRFACLRRQISRFQTRQFPALD